MKTYTGCLERRNKFSNVDNTFFLSTEFLLKGLPGRTFLSYNTLFCLVNCLLELHWMKISAAATRAIVSWSSISWAHSTLPQCSTWNRKGFMNKLRKNSINRQTTAEHIGDCYLNYLIIYFKARKFDSFFYINLFISYCRHK